MDNGKDRGYKELFIYKEVIVQCCICDYVDMKKVETLKIFLRTDFLHEA